MYKMVCCCTFWSFNIAMVVMVHLIVDLPIKNDDFVLKKRKKTYYTLYNYKLPEGSISSDIIYPVFFSENMLEYQKVL